MLMVQDIATFQKNNFIPDSIELVVRGRYRTYVIIGCWLMI